jgi:hypothetical protein
VSRFHHNDLTGEVVAKGWHQIAQAISAVAALSGVGIVVTAGAGYFWHRWAVGEHQKEIDRITKENRNDGLANNEENLFLANK